jgi:hypothetical protein
VYLKEKEDLFMLFTFTWKPSATTKITTPSEQYLNPDQFLLKMTTSTVIVTQHYISTVEGRRAGGDDEP